MRSLSCKMLSVFRASCGPGWGRAGDGGDRRGRGCDMLRHEKEFFHGISRAACFLAPGNRFTFSLVLLMVVGESTHAGGASLKVFQEKPRLFFFHRKINELMTKGAFICCCSLESTQTF